MKIDISCLKNWKVFLPCLIYRFPNFAAIVLTRKAYQFISFQLNSELPVILFIQVLIVSMHEIL